MCASADERTEPVDQISFPGRGSAVTSSAPPAKTAHNTILKISDKQINLFTTASPSVIFNFFVTFNLKKNSKSIFLNRQEKKKALIFIRNAYFLSIGIL